MSDLAPIGRPTSVAYDAGPRAARPDAVPTRAAAARGHDQVELSAAAQLLGKLRDLPDVRQGLVDRVRSEIADGSYITAPKMDSALIGLAADLDDD